MSHTMVHAAFYAVIVVGLLHIWFMVVEMFLWNTPYGRKTFGLTPEFAAASKALAANQGLYNGILGVSLIVALHLREGARPMVIFLLGCVIVAGIFGAVTANKKILFVQALPGAIALALFLFSWR